VRTSTISPDLTDVKGIYFPLCVKFVMAPFKRGLLSLSHPMRARIILAPVTTSVFLTSVPMPGLAVLNDNFFLWRDLKIKFLITHQDVLLPTVPILFWLSQPEPWRPQL